MPSMPDDRSAGAPPAVARAPRPRFGSVTIRDRGYLPHWECESATYFVTFRLAGSLPQSLLEQFRFERSNIIATAAQMDRPLSVSERRQLDRLFSTKIERYLDAGAGECMLRRPEIADIVAACLENRNDVDYRLFAWCVMPNHVHLVTQVFPHTSLAKAVQAWKSVSSHRINRALSSRGAVWGREYFDHLVRSDEELERTIRYVARNPLKAGLRRWKWVWECGRGARRTAGEAPALL